MSTSKDFETALSSLISRVALLEIETGEKKKAQSFSVGSISVPIVAGSQIPVAVYVTPMQLRSASRIEASDRTQPASEAMAPSAAVTAFLTEWASADSEDDRIAVEDAHLSSPDSAVVVEILKKRSARDRATMTALVARVEASDANAAAARAQADAALAAQASGSEKFKPAPPPRFENKEKDMEIRRWIPVVEEHYVGCPDADYLRMASSHLSGKPRSFWQSKLDARKASGEPIADPRAFFRETLYSGYGLKEEVQGFWDAYHKLKQGYDQDISEYNSEFEQVMTDLSKEVTDEPVKIEKYKAGLQPALRELARVSPDGTRWTSLSSLISYCTLQWPTIKARLEKEKKSGGHKVEKVAGKRKFRSPSRGRGSSAGPREGNSGAPGRKNQRLSEEERERRRVNKLCNICASLDHFSDKCPDRTTPWVAKKDFRKGRKDFS